MVMGPNAKSKRHVNARRSLDLTLAIREGIDPQILFRWNLAILQGLNPVLVKDDSKPLGYYIKHDDGQPSPTLDQKQRAMKELEDRGYGQAVQTIALQAELRTISLSASANLPTGQLPAPAIWQIAQVLQGALPAPAMASDHDDADAPAPTAASVIDADSRDVIEVQPDAPELASNHDLEHEAPEPAPTIASDHGELG